jgi:hypothetical protein
MLLYCRAQNTKKYGLPFYDFVGMPNKLQTAIHVFSPAISKFWSAFSYHWQGTTLSPSIGFIS